VDCCAIYVLLAEEFLGYFTPLGSSRSFVFRRTDSESSGFALIFVTICHVCMEDRTAALRYIA
jgi:hypothetical protein